MGLRGHGTRRQGYRDVARSRIGGVAGVRESGLQRERNSAPAHIEERRRQGWEGRREADAQHNEVSAVHESIEGMGRGCLSTGAAPSRSRWNSRARESMTVGGREEDRQQKSGRGLPPAPPPRQEQTRLPAPETLLKENSMRTWRSKRTTRQGSKCLWPERGNRRACGQDSG